MVFKIARILDVSEGLQANQFTIGSRDILDSLRFTTNPGSLSDLGVR